MEWIFEYNESIFRLFQKRYLLEKFILYLKVIRQRLISRSRQVSIFFNFRPEWKTESQMSQAEKEQQEFENDTETDTIMSQI